MNTEILEEIGLIPSEIKIYLALLKLGISTAGPIIKKTGMQNSTVHLYLNKLLKKGFVSYIKKGNIKYYSAINPKEILNIIDEKKEKYKNELLPDLLKQVNKIKEFDDAEVYQGYKGFKNLHRSIIEKAIPGEEWLFAWGGLTNKEKSEKIINFYNSFRQQRKEKGIVVKGICIKKDKKLIKWYNKKNMKYVEEHELNITFGIYKNYLILNSWDENETTYVLRSKDLVNSYKLYFWNLWNKH
jgi:HTH-type transcriptional regulator, sugar sensing transcriptional regulator